MIGPLLTLMLLAAVALACLLVGSIALVVRWRRVRWTLSPHGTRNRAVRFMLKTVARFRMTQWWVKKLDETAFNYLSGSVH